MIRRFARVVEGGLGEERLTRDAVEGLGWDAVLGQQGRLIAAVSRA